MNVTDDYAGGLPHRTYEIGIQDLINQQMANYALLMVVLSFVLLAYVLWNNFVRSPSKPKKLNELIDDAMKFDCDEGIEPSPKVKKISRALDEYLIIPALVMFYITISYYLSI